MYFATKSLAIKQSCPVCNSYETATSQSGMVAKPSFTKTLGFMSLRIDNVNIERTYKWHCP